MVSRQKRHDELQKEASPRLSRKEKKALARTAEKFLAVMKEKVTTYLWLEDVDALDRMVSQMDILSGYEVLKTLRDKGLSEEITKLCDKAGKKVLK